MVQIYLCGPGGAGKTTLMKQFCAEKPFDTYTQLKEVARTLMKQENIQKSDLERYNLQEFFNFQNLILKRQFYEEEKMSGGNFVSDRSVMDCLAYLYWKMEKDEQYELRIETLLQDNKALIELANEAIQRYQHSLIVVVQPWECSSPKEDGTRLSMSYTESKRFVEILHILLKQYHIGYIDLDISELNERVKVLKEAVSGKIYKNTCSLFYYAQLSKKNKKYKKRDDGQQQFNDTSIAFYLDAKNREDSFIRTVKISEDQMTQHLSKIKEQSSRFVQKYGTENLFSLQFDMKVRSVDVQMMLLGKIFINGHEYSFLGCSSSGLKSRKAFLWKGTRENAEEILRECGRFDKISSKSKRLARVGLLFSSVFTTDISADVIEVDDITTPDKKYNFTDGCGGLSRDLAKEVYSRIPDKETVNEPANYLPSVYQFRLQGIKGVVALDRTLRRKQLKIRPSMVKFESDAFPYVSVCDFSRPYSFGYLNRQLIYLLSGLGVKDEKFLAIQEEYFEMIRNVHTNADSAITFLRWNNKYIEAERIAHAHKDDKSFNSHSSKTRSLLDSMVRSLIQKDEKRKIGGVMKEKLRVLVKKSRMVYGVCDQTGQLKYGQCYVRITIDDMAKTIRGKIVSGRMPCYLLGDIRVLEAVDIPELQHLVDCVVFPTQGTRPHADEQAGGDLDGDKFFVCWDERLIPARTARSHDYIGAPNKKEGHVTYEKLIKYFSIQNEAMKVTSLLANLYDYWVDLKGAGSEECERIGVLFGRAIDATKSGEVICIPDWLNQKVAQHLNTFVWHRMVKAAVEFKRSIGDKTISQAVNGTLSINDLSEEFLCDILSQDFCNQSEFQKFHLVWLYAKSRYNWQEALGYIKNKFSHLLNFSLFTAAEKQAAIEMGMSINDVCNALFQAQVFPLEDLNHFHMLGNSSKWGLYYKSTHANFELQMLHRALTKNNSVLITWKMPNDVYIGLHFDTQLQVGNELVVKADEIKFYFISKKFALRKQHQPKMDYYYDLVEDRFQVYRNRDKRQTFLWLRSSPLNQKVKNDIAHIDFYDQDQIIDCLSMDLATFDIRGRRDDPRSHPLINKAPFLEVEVFAIKNNQPAYFDLYDANTLADILDEESIGEGEEEDEEEEERYVNEILLELLHKTSKKGEISVPELKIHLENMVAGCVPYLTEPSTEVNEKLTDLVISADFSEAGLEDLVNIMVSLSRLQQHSLAQIMSEQLNQPDVSVEELLAALVQWSVCWYVQPGTLITLFGNIKEKLLQNDTPPRVKHVVANIWICFVELLNDITLCKEDILKGAIGGLKVDQQGDSNVKNDGINAGFDATVENAKNESRSFEEEMDTNNNSDKDNIFKEENENDKGNQSRNTTFSITLQRTSPFSNLSYCPSKGDYVVLMRKKDWNECKGVKAIVCIACVANVTLVPFSIKLNLLDEQAPKLILEEVKGRSSRWMINTLQNANVTLYTRVLKASKRLLDDMPLEEKLLEAIYSGVVITQPCPPNAFMTDIKGCNQSQQDGIKAAINNTLTLIQGPPGTGKTKVACLILREVSTRKKYGVLAVAETNIAVDNMCKQLLNMNVNIVRIGNMKGISSELYEHTLEGQLAVLEDKEAEVIHCRNKDGDLYRKKKFVKMILEQANVVLTTCAGAGDTSLSGQQFQFVLVDEATQTKEATLLCALSHGAKQLVMIGDSNQLGPLVHLEKDWSWLSDQEHREVTETLENTLFDRLQITSVPVHFLNMQYRMHPSIAEYPSKTFYDTKLKSGVSEKDRLPPWQFTREPMIFIDVKGVEKSRGTSFYNEEEAEQVRHIVTYLTCDNNVRNKHIAVLSLYKGQVLRLRQSLDLVEVNSIDGFQGREAEVIIVSTVRCNRQLGFSDDKKRLNVLLTRAKRGLIVIGHRDTLSTSYIWKGWIDSVVEKTGNDITAGKFKINEAKKGDQVEKKDQRNFEKRRPYKEKSFKRWDKDETRRRKR
ncbi:uncharacterized protein LOC130662285 [Hydractinia symbiolongicarpus]|uniref:uncharacterized protein LOC130662285 n=1 Tax=Hydractinia symbiolongicarpus TaxID=13093 RepID=UPI00254CE0CC|nr:uncharacterized protein LOC130662285 [Hydractinia symbiolongicarpus]